MSSHPQEIVARARVGEEAAFRELVERHSRQVFRLAYRLTGNPHDAEEVVQETFLKVFNNIEGFDGRARFETWLFRVTHNAATDLLRKRQRHDQRRADVETPSGEPLPLPTALPGPERLAGGHVLADHIARAMETLSPGERAAFTLRHLEGRSIREIGDELGLRSGAVKNAIFRAVQKMRIALEPVVSELS